MDPASSLNFGDDSELAGYGIGELTSSIDNASFFNRIPPQAASTVARDQRPRSRETDASSGGGSFLDSEATDKPTNRIQLSFSAVDQSGTSNHNGENVRKSQSADQIQQKEDESFASMVSWGGMPPYNGSTGPSRDSSLGLIAVDKMSDLSASVLMPEFEVDNKENNKPDSQYNSAALPKGSISEPLGMPNPPNQSSSLGGHKYSYTSLSQSLSKHATPLATSDRELSNLQRSKHSTSDREMSSLQGSKHSTIDWSNNLETVKKRPSMPQKLPTLPVGGIRQSLFGCKDGTLPEDSEGDVTLPEVQFGDGELDKLDDDFGNFDATYNDSAIEQDDMVLLEEDQGEDIAELDQIYLSAGTIGNAGGGRTDGNKYPSLSKVNLFDEMGSTEDLLLADRSKEDSRKRDLSKRSSTENTQSTEADDRKSGQSVGEQRNGERKTLQHRTAEVRRSDGSEIDTEDELEMARQQQSIDMVRSEGAGQSLEANKPEQLDSERRVKKDDSNISLTMRYSAEGDIEEPPPPGDGGCGGDGESDSDSELRRQNAGTSSQESSLRAKEFIQTFKDSFKGNLNSPSGTLDIQEERVRPMGDDLLREEGVHRYSTYQTSMLGDNSGLHSQYFAPMSLPPDATANPGDSIAFQDTLYPTDDMLAQSQRDLGSSTRGAVGDPREGTITEDRLEASGFNINDFQDNNDPFDRLQSSFGSFGASPSGRGSEESHFTNVRDSPQSMARSSLNSVGSYPRPQGAGQSEERGTVQGQETEDQERNSQTSWHSGADEEDVVSSTEGTKSTSEVMEFRKPRLSLYQSQTKRKDLEPGELTKAMPVKQSSDHSPVYQKDLGKQKKERKQDKQDKDVVYRDSTGEFVTDLAFHTSFADMVATQQENLQQQFMNGTLDFDPLQNDDQFKSPSDARAMIDEDEEEFEKENVFREDENISASVVTPDSSWLQQVKTSMLCPPEMRDEMGCGMDPVRISIGTFMKSRSGAMGSLGGDSTEERPEFGMKIKTPPTNKKPCPLIEPTQDHRENVSKEGELTLFRTSGVGDEEGFSPSADKTVTLYDLHPSVDRTLKEVRADDSLPVGDNEVFTPERSIGSGTPGHRTINATLNVSEVTRAMDSLPQGTEEGVEMVLGLSKNKKSVNSHSKSEVASKQSRLPVKKGSDVLSRTLESKSPNSSLNGSKDSDKHKSKASTMPVASNLDIVENARLEELRMVSDGATGLVKSNPDGEESDRSISPITGSTSNDSSPADTRVGKKVPETVNKEHTAVVNVSHEKYVRSPRSSTSVGLTGHHVPDGTDYSLLADYPHKVKMGRTREDVDGTEDIGMADSRGFDLISRDEQVGAGQRMGQGQKVQKDRSGLFVVPDSDNDTDCKKSAHRTRSGSASSDHMKPRPDTGPHKENISDLRKVHSDIGVKMVAAIEKEQLELHRQYENDDFRLRANSSPVLTRDLDGQSKGYLPNYREPIHTEAALRESDHSKSSSNQSLRNEKLFYQDDRDLMPPPPSVDSHRDLVKAHSVEKPRLLTERTLMVEEFAQPYLVRDAPRTLAAKQMTKTNPMLPANQWNGENSMVTPGQDRHHSALYEQKEFNPSPNLENMSILNHMPAYHSTPYVERDNTTLLSQTFVNPDNTLSTSTMVQPRESVRTSGGSQKSHRASRDSIGHIGLKSKLSAIEAPCTMRFSKVCCIGIFTRNFIPLTNPTSYWLECLLRVKSLTIDGNPVNVEANNPFEMKQKVIVEGDSTENLEVTFVPKVAGAYVAQLQIYSLLFASSSDSDPEKIPTEITIQAIAENPNVEIAGNYTGDHPILQFGQVKWGSCTQLTLTVVNRGLATIPLRLAITSHRVPWHCFAFDRGSQPASADISVISRSSRLQSPALGRTVMTLSIPGLNEESDYRACEREIKVWCRPPHKSMESGLQLQRADEMSAIVKVEVDTPSTMRPLKVVELRALVGFPRLHIHRQHDNLKFKAAPGKESNTNLVLKNVGNINLDLHFEFMQHESLFSICPWKLSIPPGEQVSPIVTFKPGKDERKLHFKSLLLMVEEPDGPSYELDVIADVVEYNNEAAVLSDRRYVAFGGVAVAKSVEKKLTVLNGLDQELKVNLQTRSEMGDFKIRVSTIHQKRVTDTCDIILQPREKFPVHVWFSPSENSVQTGKLFIKPYGYMNKYSIPLSGYGGISELILQGPNVRDGNCYVVDLGEVTVGAELGVTHTLRNTGVRAAYVKIKAFSAIGVTHTLRKTGVRAVYVKIKDFFDPSCCRSSITNRILAEPNNFIIQPGEAKSITLTINISEREEALCSYGRGTVSTVVFYYGDEIMRQRLRRAYQSGCQSSLPRNVDPVLADLRFNEPFMGEEDVFENAVPKAVEPKHHIDKFYFNMSRLVVAMVGAAPGHLSTRTPQLHSRSSRTSSCRPSVESSTHSTAALSQDNSPVSSSNQISSRGHSSDFTVPSYRSSSLNRQSNSHNYKAATSNGASHRRTASSDMEPLRATVNDIPMLGGKAAQSGSAYHSSDMVPSRDDSKNKDFARSLPASLYNECLYNWTIKPDQLILYVSPKDPGNVQIQKFQITNLSGNKLRYSLNWPEQYLNLTPEVGIVDAKNYTTVCVSASAWVYKNTTELPFALTVTVECWDTSGSYQQAAKQKLGVLIRTEPSDSVPLEVQERSHDLLAPPTSVALSLKLPSVSSPGSFTQAVVRDVKFPATKVGEVSETVIEVQNVSDDAIHWLVTSLAPPYVKGAEGSTDVIRALYKVFDFTDKYGCLVGGNSIKLKVRFMPRSSGTFIQNWDIESKKGSKPTRVQLIGEAIPVEDVRRRSAGNSMAAVTDQTEKKTGDGGDQTIEVDPEGVIKFSSCAPGQAQILKISIKNRSMDNQLVEIIPPQSPFFVRHLAFEVKKKRYLRYPVEFRPEEQGPHHGLLIIKYGHYKTIDVRLEGMCKD